MRVLHWFRKDLRLADNTALHEAARDSGGDVVPFYASEPDILGQPDIAAIRVQFVLDALAELSGRIETTGSHLALDHGPAVETVLRAARGAGADAVYWNEEYEPERVRRDDAVEAVLRSAGIRVRRFHDRLLVPPDTVRTGQGDPYVVYSPFRRACETLPLGRPLPEVRRFTPHALPRRSVARIESLGFTLAVPAWPAGERAARKRLEGFVAEGLARYAADRDWPAIGAGSKLSPHLRFGTISPRTVAAAALDAAGNGAATREAADKFVAELRWRDFYAHVLFHFPHAEHGAFRTRYDALPWSGDESHFEAWREGRTGYPLVDAGMRELAATGFMHNRVRMITASFLVKDLLLDWRRGERHFMRHLVDGDLASNNGGWQWAASTGTDAQPYFRIFNPVLQGARYDPDGDYVKRWVPELSGLPRKWIHRPWEAPGPILESAGVRPGATYPAPIVDHAVQRDLALEMFSAVGG
jgi:deoxyribodipyrimidine photo-lyase